MSRRLTQQQMTLCDLEWPLNDTVSFYIVLILWLLVRAYSLQPTVNYHRQSAFTYSDFEYTERS